MTRAQRRIRNERARATAGGLRADFRQPFALGVHLAENPNSGYRKPSNPTRVRLTETGPAQALRTIPRG